MLLTIHAPILVLAIISLLREGVDPSRLGNVIALAVSLAFFTLKLCNVPWLRLRTRQQAFITTCVLTAVVHHGAAMPALEEPIVLQTTVALTSAGVASFIVRRRSALLSGWRERLAALLARRVVHHLAALHDDARRCPCTSEVPLHITIPRAPPA